MYNGDKIIGQMRNLYPVLVRQGDSTFDIVLSHDPGSLRYQIEMELLYKLHLGRSKHDAKKHNHGKVPRNLILYSKTYIDYKNLCFRFADWLRPDIKTLAEARKYVPVFLRKCKQAGYTPGALKNMGCALGKLYSCSMNDFDFKYPMRCRADRDFSEQALKVTDFFQRDPMRCLAYVAQGLRGWKELTKIHAEDYRFSDWTGHIWGKNGRPRRFAILPSLEYIVKDFVDEATANGQIKPFCNPPADVPLHHLRRIYGCLFYLHLARPVDEIPQEQRYYCRKDLAGLHLDRVALWQVSKYMGHTRESVTVDYIAPFVQRDEDGHLVINNPLALLPGADVYFKGDRKVDLRLDAWLKMNEKHKAHKDERKA